MVRLLGVAAALQEQQQVLVPGGDAGLQDRLDAGADVVPDLGPHLRRRPAQRPRVLGPERVAPVRVVVEGRELRAPGRPHREAGGQDDPDHVPQGRRPGVGRAHGGTAPVPLRHGAAEFTTVTEERVLHQCVGCLSVRRPARSSGTGVRDGPIPAPLPRADHASREVGRCDRRGSATIPAWTCVSTLPAFLLAVLLISASPGPAMALIFRRAALRGMSRRRADGARSRAGALLLGAVRRRRLRRARGRVGGRLPGAAGGRGRGPALPRGSARSARRGWSGRRPGGARPAARPRTASLVGRVRRGRRRAAGQPEGRRLHDRVLPAVRAGGRAGLRHDGAARPPADHGRDRPVPGPGGGGRAGGHLVPPAAHPAPARGGQRQRARRAWACGWPSPAAELSRAAGRRRAAPRGPARTCRP